MPQYEQEAAEIIYAGFTIDRDMIDLAYKNHPQHQMGRKPYPDMLR